MSIQLTFLRHACTDANLKSYFSGSEDLPLNEAGEKQLEQVRATFEGETFDVVLFGHAKRVVQTKDAALSVLRAQPKILLQKKEIREINFGLFEGLSADEIEAKYPDAWQEYMNHWENFTFPQGDNTLEYYEACSKWIHEVLFEYDNHRVMVVAHKGFIAACVTALSTGLMENMFHVEIGNAQALNLRL